MFKQGVGRIGLADRFAHQRKVHRRSAHAACILAGSQRDQAQFGKGLPTLCIIAGGRKAQAPPPLDINGRGEALHRGHKHFLFLGQVEIHVRLSV